MPKALIFGVSGQAGSYLAELLLAKGYEVVGTVREHSSQFSNNPVKGVHYHYELDLAGREVWEGVAYVVAEYAPTEIYNLASIMYAPASWDSAATVMEVNAMAVVYMLEAIKGTDTKFFQAGSAEIFDKTCLHAHDETSVPKPSNPYGVSKLAAQELVRSYRKKYGLRVCTGIFFNMESERRPKTFFAQKVTSEVVRIRRELDEGKQPEPLKLGTLWAYRDWGLTKEYVEAAWLMLQQWEGHPWDDFVIGTGEMHSCLEFVNEVLQQANVGWEHVQYEKLDKGQGRDMLCAYPDKIAEHLGWRAKTSFVGVIKELLQAEMKKEVVVG